MLKAVISLSGLTCASCVRAIEQTLKDLPGIYVHTIAVNLLMSQAVLEYDDTQVSIQQIVQTINDSGYDVEDYTVNKTGKKSRQSHTGETIVTIDEDDLKGEPEGACQITTASLEVTGMTCASCVNTIQHELEALPGVESAQVNLLTHKAKITYDQQTVGIRGLITRIEEMGFDASPIKTDHDKQGNAIRERAEREQSRLRERFRFSLWAAIPTLIIAMVIDTMLDESNSARVMFTSQIVPGLEVGTLILFLIATPVQLFLGYPFYAKAWRSLYYARVGNMDTLVAIGTTTAYIGSVVNVAIPIAQGLHEPGKQFFETSIFLITFIWLGRWMESKAKGKTYETITKLMDLQPETATLVKFDRDEKNGEEHEVDLALVQVGDILKVNAGARAPCDGIIYRGITSLDESMLTGESLPVTKGVGDEVISATVNQSSTIWIKATRVGSDTTLSRIITLVQEAQSSKKAPIEALADKIAHVFVPAVVLVSLLTYFTWFSLGAAGKIPDDWIPTGQNYPVFSLFFAVSVMVIACPCAMGLASPTAIMVGTGKAAQFGVLVKGGGEAIEMAHRVDIIAFDKTGTLTYGKPKVVSKKVLYEEQSREREQLLLRIIQLVESSSDHPLAKAVTQHIAEETVSDRYSQSYGPGDLGVDPNQPAFYITMGDVTEIPGKGLVAGITIDDSAIDLLPSDSEASGMANFLVYVGNEKWLRDNGCIYPPHISEDEARTTLRGWQASGYSVVLVGLAGTGGADGLILAQFGVADTPRSDAAKTVVALKKLGIRVWMITGDNRVTAGAVASKIGIENVLAEVGPEEKAEKIKWLQKSGLERRGGRETDDHETGTPPGRSFVPRLRCWSRSVTTGPRRAVVAMVGDGINDSPALAQSDLAISISSATDVAIESSSVILTRSTLTSLVTLISLAHAIIRRIRLNFLWAYIYNTLAIPIAAGVFFPAFKFVLRPEISGLAMAASSISVVMSSLWLRRFREPVVPEIQELWKVNGRLQALEQIKGITFDVIDNDNLVYSQRSEQQPKQY